MKPIRFTLDDANKAGDAWKFNCGPGALCAVLDLTPDQLRPYLGDFERKGYMNPTMVMDTLKWRGVAFERIYRNEEPLTTWSIPNVPIGLMRTQSGGPWMKPGVPMAARYWHTHWVAIANGTHVFDINAVCVGGWIPATEWREKLMPWLLKETCPKGDGTFWPTHVYDVKPDFSREAREGLHS